MVKKLNIQWNARQVHKMYRNGGITVDNAIQRGYVWDMKRKAMLIESMLLGYPIPPFYAKREGKVFDMLDGKQRIQAISSYFNNEYALSGVAEEFEGLYFDDLPEELQDELLMYSLTVYYFENITDEEINEMFYRLNNGKALSAIELTRVKVKSFDKLKELAAHEIFKDALKESQINKYSNEDIVIKALVMLNVDKPSLENKFIRPYIIETEITEEMAAVVNTTLTRIKYIHDRLLTEGYIKQAKKVYTRTHLISLIPLAYKTYLEQTGIDEFKDFVKYFFTPVKRGASVSRLYNDYSSSGSNSAYAVETRQRELTEHFEKYIGGK